MRCLTLAKQLRSHGIETTFICRNFKGNSILFLKSQGVKVIVLPFPNNTNNDLQWVRQNWEIDATETISLIKDFNNSIDLIIVDHYALDIQWERKLRPCTGRIMVIDDLADRQHDCDLLLDQNYYLNMEGRYNDLVPRNCKRLLGPNYALLREEFYQAAEKPRVRSGKIDRILLFFGGTDPTGETVKVLEAIRELSISNLQVDVVVGSANPRKNQIEKKCSEIPNVTYYCQVDNMAELMMKADLSIGAGGSTTLERCFLGLPTATVVTAKNQLETTHALSDKGVILYWGLSSQLTSNDYKNRLKGLLKMKLMNKPALQFGFMNQIKKHAVVKEIQLILP